VKDHAETASFKDVLHIQIYTRSVIITRNYFTTKTDAKCFQYLLDVEYGAMVEDNVKKCKLVMYNRLVSLLRQANGLSY